VKFGLPTERPALTELLKRYPKAARVARSFETRPGSLPPCQRLLGGPPGLLKRYLALVVAAVVVVVVVVIHIKQNGVSRPTDPPYTQT
jgi:SpoVK/Ycf46/Vps4 family AAA+-type ATPase